MNRHTVLLYGRSLLLSGVGAGLAECAEVHASQASDWDDASRLMSEQPADVLIFDLMNDNESHVLSLILTNPDLLIIGLDSERNRAVVVSGHEARSLTVNQIIEMVQRTDVPLLPKEPVP